MSGNEQRAGRCFVAPATLDAYETVLDKVNAAHRIAAGDSIQQFDQRNRSERPAIHADGGSGLEADLDRLDFVGRGLRGIGQLPRIVERLAGWIFQFTAFMRNVPQVAIAAVDLLTGCSNRDTVALGVVDR